MDKTETNEIRETLLETIKKLGYVKGASVEEPSLPSILESYTEQRKVGNIKDYLVLSLSEQTGNPKNKGSYDIFVKGRK